MSDGTQHRMVAALLDRYGRTFSDELGIDLAKDTPAPLFQWLCAALLMSARILTSRSLQAAFALKRAGWTTAQRMADSRWEDRVRVLDDAGYARFDESAARMLGDTAKLLLAAYGGDLRKLREKAERNPTEEKRLLMEFKGIGEMGADIFLREVQLEWNENYPFADSRALAAAAHLGLPHKAEGLARLVPREEFPRLVAALVRASLAGDLDQILRT